MKKILYIEDETEQIWLVRDFLAKTNYEFIFAEDAEEGLKKASKEKPDLILIDLFLPEIDGLEVCKRLKQAPETKNIPVIIITASGVDYVEDQCKTAGANDYIKKPYERAQLIKKIKKYI